MSRSYREPYHPNPDGCKIWKRDWNKSLRQKEELPDGAYYKKINDRWSSPIEHKGCWIGEWLNGKMRRK